ncbi:MAG: glycosyltransferase family 39 protein [bacterium]|nr:glycosyltransferase family 39 protein [bacterium]
MECKYGAGIPGKVKRYISWGILLIAFLLLFIRLSFLCFWGDEAGVVEVITRKIKHFYEGGHPCLYYIFAYLWTKIFGISESGLRSFSSLCAIGTVFVSYKLISKVTDKKTACLSILLLSLSPFFILFSRMGRYYSLTGLLSISSLYFFQNFLEKDDIKSKIFYTLVTAALFYTEYFAGATIVIIENLYVLFRKRNLLFLKKWFLSQLVILLAFSPFIGISVSQVTACYKDIPVELSTGLKSMVVKLFCILYDFCFGETILPLELWVVIPGVLVYLICFINSIKRVGFLSIFLILVLPVSMAVFLTSGYTPAVPIAHIARILLFIVPLCYAIISIGILNLKNRVLRMGCFIIIVLISCYGLRNYFTKSHFINPHYVIPWKEIVQDIKEKALPGDRILTPDMCFEYYSKNLLDLTVLSFYSIKSGIEDSACSRIWLVVRDRGQRNVVERDNALMDSLDKYGLKEIMQKKYVKLSPLDIYFKEKLLKREVWDYNVKVFLYAKDSAGYRLSL